MRKVLMTFALVSVVLFAGALPLMADYFGLCLHGCGFTSTYFEDDPTSIHMDAAAVVGSTSTNGRHNAYVTFDAENTPCEDFIVFRDEEITDGVAYAYIQVNITTEPVAFAYQQVEQDGSVLQDAQVYPEGEACGVQMGVGGTSAGAGGNRGANRGRAVE